MFKLEEINLMRLVCVLFATKLVVLIVLALNTLFVMDEFWQFGQSKYLWNGFYETIWPVKSVGYALWYAPAHELGWDATSTLLAGRLWAVSTVLATCAVIAAIGRALGYSWLATIMVLVLLLSVSTYMERSFRLRSETPATLFAALSLWVVVRRPALPGLRAILSAGVFTGFAFLCTQKAVYFNLGLGLGLVTVFLRDGGMVAALRAGVVLLAGWALALLAYGVLMGGANAVVVLRQVFMGPVELATTGGSLYEGLEQFIVQTLSRNLPLYLIFGAGLLLALTRWKTRSPGALLLAVFTAVITALIFTHNQPWPYIFAMALPFLALWAPLAWDHLIASGPKRKTADLIVIALVVLFSFARNLSYLDHANAEQLELIRTSESILGPDDTYFDGIGMLPTHADTPRRWLDAPGIARVRDGRDDLMAALGETPPDLIIETYRTDGLPPAFAAWKEAHYVAIAPGLWVPGSRVLPGEEATLQVLKDTRFDLAGDAAQLYINDAATDLPTQLTPGSYRLTAPGANAPVLVLPEGTPVPNHRAPRKPLFLDVYTR